MASLHPYQTDAGRRYVVRWREGGKHRGRTFHRQRDARSFQGDIIRRQQLGELYEDEGSTLGEFLEGWEKRYALRVRASSAGRRTAALRALERSSPIMARPLARLSAAEVEDVVSEIAARAPRQAQLALASLKLALRDAAKRSLKFDRRIFELTPPRARSRAPRFLTWEEVQRLAEWLPDRHARLVMVAALTGLRRGEMMALTWGDVDLDAATLTVRAGKTEAARRAVDLPATAVVLLREQMEVLTEGGVTPGGEGARSTCVLAGSIPASPAPPSVSTPVFPNNRGGHLDGHNWYTRWFKPAAKATGFDMTFHDLRHGYASMLAAANVNPKVAAALMGHADGGALFLRRYSHLYPGAGRQAAEALEAIL